jgi:hypothetical protein
MDIMVIDVVVNDGFCKSLNEVIWNGEDRTDEVSETYIDNMLVQLQFLGYEIPETDGVRLRITETTTKTDITYKVENLGVPPPIYQITDPSLPF